MNNSQIELVQFYDQFENLGFKAGITLKADWASENEVYRHINEKVIPPGMRMVVPEQVHGSDLLMVDCLNTMKSCEVDGVISGRADVCLTVTTADCVPLLFADPVSRYFGAVHVGWRSFIAGILDNLFYTIINMDISIDKMRILTGPAIGPCCFEITGEVAALFNQDVVVERDSKLYVDLLAAIRNKLESYGVVDSHTESIPDCTSCGVERYYSYRRDKLTEAQLVSFIYRLS